MRVASISHMFPNCVQPNNGVFVKERLKHVSDRVDLTVIAPIPKFPFIDHTAKYAGLSRVGQQEIIDGLKVHHPRYFMIPKYMKFLDATFYATSLSSYMQDMMRTFKYKILDFHWVFPDGIGGLGWARKLGGKTVVTVRGNEAIYFYERNIPRRIVQKRLAEFDHVITVSRDLKDKVLRHYGVEESRVSVVPNGIDTSKFFHIGREASVRKCQIDPAKRYILTVCRLSKEKGLTHLLHAFKQLRCPEVRLIVAGDGPLKAALSSLCADLNIADRVQFLGTLGHADLCAWYNAVDVFCLPSLWEGCPNVVIEALACGTPVVATNVGGIPDLVADGDCGLLIPPGDADSLATALNSALERSWNRPAISRYGSANSWQDVAGKVINVFERVLS